MTKRLLKKKKDKKCVSKEKYETNCVKKKIYRAISHFSRP
jgi:hypothetical protein